MDTSKEHDDTKVTVPFPAETKQASTDIGGIKTEVTCTSFSDKILLTITQNGKLGQWVTVPMLSDNPTEADPYFARTTSTSSGADGVVHGEDYSLLPASRFQARTLLGAGNSDREVMGQLYASQIASMITTKHPGEERQLLLGLGLAKVDTERDTFLEIVNLALQVI